MLTCHRCQKPFVSTSSKTRHLKYCGTRQRTRQRACQTCNSAKSRCNFETPCQRCIKKGLTCTYEAERAIQHEPNNRSMEGSLLGSSDVVLPRTAMTMSNSSVRLENVQIPIGVAISSAYSSDTATWCSWLKPGFSTSFIFDESNVIATLHQSGRNQAADTILRALRSFPIMLLRRETFPAFINKHSPLLPPLAACMGISQMFCLRTSDTLPVIWQAIRREHEELIRKMYEFSKLELTSALQSCMMYFIMFLTESEHTQKDSMDLILALQILTTHWKMLNRLEWKFGAENWEDWIVQESQVRLFILWLLIGVVVSVKTDTKLDPTNSYRDVLLPCSRHLWEARTAKIWADESRSMISQCHMKNLGDLIEQQWHPTSGELDKWNAGVDELGFLLNLVGDLIERRT